jgi:hypothetical protein
MQRCPETVSGALQRRERRVEVLAHTRAGQTADITVIVSEQLRYGSRWQDRSAVQRQQHASSHHGLPIGKKA